MGSMPAAEETTTTRPHAVMIPYPAQGHVTPMLKLAKLLYSRGFHVTFVNNEFNHRRLLRSRGASALDGAPGFRFAAIDDGLPPSDADATQDISALCHSVRTTCLPRFKALLAKLDEEADAAAAAAATRRVTCVVADSTMAFAILAARELGLRCATLWTASACGFMGYYHYKHLLDRGLFPLKSEADLNNGHLDTTVDWIPRMPADLRLRDLPSFVRSTDRDDIMFNFFIHVTATMPLASAVIINTFDELDAPLMGAMAALLPPIYTVGPLHLTVRNNLPADSPVAGVGSNLWKEQDEPLRWLDGRPPRSVVYVNFGSITVMSAEHLLEFAWGLAGSGYAFLWNVRPDLVKGDGAALPPEFAAATEARSMLSTWCPQAEVLEHEAVGVFLTHSGWNSTLESIVAGVPMVCWPFFAEQQTNCRYKCTEWGIGMEITDDVRRGEVEALIRESMDGEKGREMRRRVAELRDSAVASGQQGGRSMQNLDRLIDEVLLQTKAITREAHLHTPHPRCAAAAAAVPGRAPRHADRAAPRLAEPPPLDPRRLPSVPLSGCWRLETIKMAFSSVFRRGNVKELISNVSVYTNAAESSGGMSLLFKRWATKKTAGSTKNGRDSNPKYLGVKKFGGEKVEPGNIIVRQRGTRFHPGNYVGMGKDHTLFCLKEGHVRFERNKLTGRKWVHVDPVARHVLHPVYASDSITAAEMEPL